MDPKLIKLIIMSVLTTLFFLAEIIVGYRVNSLALIADSFHMLSDLLALVIAMFAIRLSNRKASDVMTFGWTRTEVLGGLINGVILIALCFNIVVEAIQRFFSKENEIKEPVLLLIVASVGLAFNIVGLFVFSSGSHGGHSHSHGHGRSESTSEKSYQYPERETETDLPQLEIQNKKSISVEPKEHSSTMRSVFLHVLGDALGSVAVIASSLFIWLTKFSWRFYADPIISIILSLILIRSSVRLIKTTSATLIQRVPRSVDLKIVREKIKTIDGVLSIHDLHLWELDDRRLIATCHIAINSSVDFMELGRQVKDSFHDLGIHSTTIQPEFVDTSNQITSDSCSLVCLEETCRKRVCCTSE